jgi:hypothetical protein
VGIAHEQRGPLQPRHPLRVRGGERIRHLNGRCQDRLHLGGGRLLCGFVVNRRPSAGEQNHGENDGGGEHNPLQDERREGSARHIFGAASRGLALVSALASEAHGILRLDRGLPHR